MQQEQTHQKNQNRVASGKKNIKFAQKGRPNGSYENVGRPTVMTENVLNKLESAFAMDCTVLEACSYADISTQTYYDYVNSNPKFADRIVKLRQRPMLKARTEIIKGLEGNPEFSLKYAERKASSEFRSRVEVDDLGKNDELKEVNEKLNKLIKDVKRNNTGQ